MPDRIQPTADEQRRFAAGEILSALRGWRCRTGGSLFEAKAAFGMNEGPTQAAPQPDTEIEKVMSFEYPACAGEILPDSWQNRYRFPFTVRSSSGRGDYRVSFDTSGGYWMCSCRGCVTHGKCKHLAKCGLSGRAFGRIPFPGTEAPAVVSQPEKAEPKKATPAEVREEVETFLAGASADELACLREAL